MKHPSFLPRLTFLCGAILCIGAICTLPGADALPFLFASLFMEGIEEAIRRAQESEEKKSARRNPLPPLSSIEGVRWLLNTILACLIACRLLESPLLCACCLACLVSATWISSATHRRISGRAVVTSLCITAILT